MVLVRVRRAPAGFLVQRLVVPQPHAVDTEQLGRGLPERGVERQRPDRGVVLPQVDALVERLRVRAAFLEWRRIALARRHRVGHQRFVEVELGFGQQPVDDDEAVASEPFDERRVESTIFRHERDYPAGSSLRPSVAHHDAVSRSPSTLPRGWISSNTRR